MRTGCFLNLVTWPCGEKLSVPILLILALGSAACATVQPPMPGKNDGFNDAEAYEQFMGRWSRKLAPALIEWGDLKPNDAVLDVGSGTGVMSFAVIAAEPTARVTGIDPSEGFTRGAQAHAPNDHVTFKIGDAQALQFAPATFDRTFCLLVMSFIPDAPKAVREMIRVTRPSGPVIAATWDYGGAMQMLDIFWEEVIALDPSMVSRDERKMPLRRQGELAALWRSQGLERVEEKAVVIEQPYTSFDDYWLPFLNGPGPAGAYAKSLAPEARAALEKRLRARLLGNGPDRPFSLSVRAWVVKGYVAAR